jgi:hypothetical protein
VDISSIPFNRSGLRLLPHQRLQPGIDRQPRHRH